MISRVLVPMDDSEMAEKALQFAVESFPEATITVLHVVGKPTPFMGEAVGLALADDLDAATRERAAPIFERAEAIANDREVEISTTYVLGSPSKAIVNQSEKYDLVVLGAHGRDPISRLLIGNVASTVTRRAPIPVTVVR